MRLDTALVERSLASSRNRAARLIAERRVRVNGETATKASLNISDADIIEADVERWVSRAAYKLIGALDQAGIVMPPRVLDAGASTGGFTQVCLERGAHRVYAVDVGHGQLVSQLREDSRVVVHEGVNLRDLQLAHLDDEPVDLVVGDVSFISLTLLLEPLFAVCRGTALLLVKPQFEVGREKLGAGGIVADERERAHAVERVVDAAARLGWEPWWRGTSTLPGTHGNVEVFLAMHRKG